MYCFGEICRICMKNTKINCSLYDTDDDNIQLLDKLLSLTPNTVQPDDTLPTFLCTQCLENLKQAYKFQAQCLHSYNKLKYYLQELQNKRKFSELNNSEMTVIIKVDPDSPFFTENSPENLNIELVTVKNEFGNEIEDPLSNLSLGKKPTKPKISTIKKTKNPSKIKQKDIKPKSVQKQVIKFKKDFGLSGKQIFRPIRPKIIQKEVFEFKMEDPLANLTVRKKMPNKKISSNKNTKSLIVKKKQKEEKSVQEEVLKFRKDFGLSEDSNINQSIATSLNEDGQNEYPEPIEYLEIMDSNTENFTQLLIVSSNSESENRSNSKINELLRHINPEHIPDDTENDTNLLMASENQIEPSKLSEDDAAISPSTSKPIIRHKTRYTAEELSVCREKLKEIDKKIQETSVQNPENPVEFSFPNPFNSDLKYSYICDTDQSYYFCKECNRNIACYKSFRSHLTRHFGIKLYGCKLCDKRFLTYAELLAHMDVHAIGKNAVCTICGKAFKSVGLLKKHVVIHEGKIACDKCGKNFPSIGRLNYHIKYNHSDVPGCICTICGTSFKRIQHLNRHIKNIHENNPRIRKWRCDTCDKCFTTKIKLRSHELLHI